MTDYEKVLFIVANDTCSAHWLGIRTGMSPEKVHAKLTATSRTEPEDDGSGEGFDNLDELKEYVKEVNENDRPNRSWMPFLNVVCE